jgi:hypothetical protein
MRNQRQCHLHLQAGYYTTNEYQPGRRRHLWSLIKKIFDVLSQVERMATGRREREEWLQRVSTIAITKFLFPFVPMLDVLFLLVYVFTRV